MEPQNATSSYEYDEALHPPFVQGRGSLSKDQSGCTRRSTANGHVALFPDSMRCAGACQTVTGMGAKKMNMKANEVRVQAKTFAYSLFSFSWPGP